MSIEQTLEHIGIVQSYLEKVIQNLELRKISHDKSKLEEPEASIFEIYTKKLKNTTYGSDEYNQYLKEMQPALDHHYAFNSHHPEHYGYLECNGCFKRFPKDYEKPCDVCGYTQFQFRPNIQGMSLLDLIEMLVDWKAATLRHANGDILMSVEYNQKRFGYGDELKQILLNTLLELQL